jgi:phage terminase Nu1 subunit (DNA packaging protein)
MIKDLETHKAKVKEALLQTVDEHFAAFENGSNQADFDIHSIERLMLAHDRKVKQVLEQANAALSGSVAVEVKKNARHANPPLKG